MENASNGFPASGSKEYMLLMINAIGAETHKDVDQRFTQLSNIVLSCWPEPTPFYQLSGLALDEIEKQLFESEAARYPDKAMGYIRAARENRDGPPLDQSECQRAAHIPHDDAIPADYRGLDSETQPVGNINDPV